MRQHNRQPADVPAAFICGHCGQTVSPEADGTMHRNHCPHCLWSVHLDLRPGDRRCGCRGDMEPIAVWIRRGGEWALIHRCQRCGALRSNRIAGDDNEWALMSLAVRALALPPFPLDRMSGPGGAQDDPHNTTHRHGVPMTASATETYGTALPVVPTGRPRATGDVEGR